jgi:hypothetical protein
LNAFRSSSPQLRTTSAISDKGMARSSPKRRPRSHTTTTERRVATSPDWLKEGVRARASSLPLLGCNLGVLQTIKRINKKTAIVDLQRRRTRDILSTGGTRSRPRSTCFITKLQPRTKLGTAQWISVTQKSYPTILARQERPRRGLFPAQNVGPVVIIISCSQHNIVIISGRRLKIRCDLSKVKSVPCTSCEKRGE